MTAETGSALVPEKVVSLRNDLPHISVCICTFKRAELLKRLLGKLVHQTTEGRFTYSVVVADNDPDRSAEPVVSRFAATSYLSALYCHEPEQNIARARNRAVSNARGAFIAFIDDDELPEAGWLLNLFSTCETNAVDGVLGPVRPYFEHAPPHWVTDGRFFERPRYRTGHRLHWSQTRSGNVLMRTEVMQEEQVPFRPEFGTGSEDLDFFRRVMEKGRQFAWCDEAPVYELVPPSRCTCAYVLRRAAIQAGNFPKITGSRIRYLVKSIVAVPLYAATLPVIALGGIHRFVWHLEKLSYHAAHILASCGFTPKFRRG